MSVGFWLAHTLRFIGSDWFVFNRKDKEGTGQRSSLTDSHDGLNLWLRLEYVRPTATECGNLPHAELIQSRVLRSRAFSPVVDRID